MFDTIVYEQPLNERIRLFLRLERLFQRIDHHAEQSSLWDTQACVRTLLELSELTSRGDLKNDVMKELERHHCALKPLAEDPAVDNSRLTSLLDKQQSLLKSLYDSDGKLTKYLRTDEMLMAVQQRVCVAGGGCDFDLPLYHQWLQSPQTERLAHIQQWIAPFDQIREAILLCLEVLRLSANTQQVTAEQGYYDQVVDTNRPIQMIRIVLGSQSQCYPEVSAGKHRFSIRFSAMASTYERPAQVKEDISFSLLTCGI